MFAKLAQIALFAASAAAEIRELVAGDKPQDVLNGNDFAIVSFFKPSDTSSVEVDSLMEGAQAFLEDKVSKEEWTERSVGWFRVDLEKTPELAMTEDDSPDQVVIGPGMNRMIHFKKVRETQAENEQLLAMVVRELTGDWVGEVPCDIIQGQKRWFYDEVVYFGDREDLEDGGDAHFLNTVSMIDRFTFDEQRVGFWYNTDPKCREDRALEADKKYLVFYHGENSIPFILEFGKDKIDLQRALHQLTVGIVTGTPRWGQRANAALFNHFVNGLIYMMPEQLNPEELQNDWRVMLMVRMIEVMQEHETSFIPIVTPFKQEPADQMLVPQLSDLIAAEKDELPNFFVLHPMTEQLVPYPDPLDDVQNFSPELILLWSRRTILYLEVELFESSILEFEKKKTDGEEVTQEEEDRITHIRETLKEAQEEQKIVMEKFESIEAQLKEKNHFAEALEEHKSVSHDHIHRIEQADAAATHDEL